MYAVSVWCDRDRCGSHLLIYLSDTPTLRELTYRIENSTMQLYKITQLFAAYYGAWREVSYHGYCCEAAIIWIGATSNRPSWL